MGDDMGGCFSPPTKRERFLSCFKEFVMCIVHYHNLFGLIPNRLFRHFAPIQLRTPFRSMSEDFHLYVSSSAIVNYAFTALPCHAVPLPYSMHEFLSFFSPKPALLPCSALRTLPAFPPSGAPRSARSCTPPSRSRLVLLSSGRFVLLSVPVAESLFSALPRPRHPFVFPLLTTPLPLPLNQPTRRRSLSTTLASASLLWAC